jgi:hypothetical protein
LEVLSDQTDPLRVHTESEVSLPRWIAYWAVGHHQAMQIYANKISELLAKMFAIMPRILPVNKSSANTYIETVYEGVYTLTASLNTCWVNEALHVSLQFARRLNGSDEVLFSGEIRFLHSSRGGPHSRQVIIH